MEELEKAKAEAKKGNVERLKRFTQKKEARAWPERGQELQGDITTHGYSLTEYLDKVRWPGELRRYMAVDVQQDHFWVVIRAVAADVSSRLIYAADEVQDGKVYRSKVGTWEEVRAVQEKYDVPNRSVLVDAKEWSTEVYKQCFKYDWTALLGDGAQSFQHIIGKGKHRKSVWREVSEKRMAGPQGTQARMYKWSNLKVKDILSRLRSGTGVPWEVADDVGQAYRKQIDSEVRRKQVNKKDGSESWIWVKVKRHNHLFDCEAMIVVGLLLSGMISGESAEDKPSAEDDAGEADG